MLPAVSITLDSPYLYQVLGVECRIPHMLSIYPYYFNITTLILIEIYICYLLFAF